MLLQRKTGLYEYRVVVLCSYSSSFVEDRIIIVLPRTMSLHKYIFSVSHT